MQKMPLLGSNGTKHAKERKKRKEIHGRISMLQILHISTSSLYHESSNDKFLSVLRPTPSKKSHSRSPHCFRGRFFTWISSVQHGQHIVHTAVNNYVIMLHLTSIIYLSLVHLGGLDAQKPLRSSKKGPTKKQPSGMSLG